MKSNIENVIIYKKHVIRMATWKSKKVYRTVNLACFL